MFVSRHVLPSPSPPAATTELWQKISVGGVAFCGILGIINVGLHFSHEEHPSEVKYSYNKIRTKAFPWADDQCDLFDFECKAKKNAL